MSKPAIEHLFVYGTLRRAFGHPMHQTIVESAHALGEAVAPGRLYDLGPYPGLRLEEATDAGVRGEVYRLDPARAAETLARLDAYEGIRAGEVGGAGYRREQVLVRCGEEVLAVWVYLLTALPAAAVPVPGGDYLAWTAER